MIELKNVSKYFQTKTGKNYTLRNVNLIIPSHTNVGIVGRNGAGKTTLMRMLGQIEFPNKGSIISSHSFSWPMGLSAGFINKMSARANIKFVCRLYGKNTQEILEIIEAVDDFSELGKYFDMPIYTYSSGMKARLNFGLSLMFDFDYLLIDETLSVGDARFQTKSKEALLKKIDSCSIILVSHNMKTLRDLCEAGVVIHEGKLEYFPNIADAIDAYHFINKGDTP
ncbi:MAG: ABC transporter ATP-binding protein [Sulfurovum sp.]|nr:ABC transporter ATP-binding protein [Sulfurovum sp.]